MTDESLQEECERVIRKELERQSEEDKADVLWYRREVGDQIDGYLDVSALASRLLDWFISRG